MLMTEYSSEIYGLKYNLTFKNNLLLIGGNSGVGKTLLYKRLKVDSLINNSKIICINIDDKLIVNVSKLIRDKSGYIIVIDNACLLLSNKDRYFVSTDTRNQYIIFTHTTSGFKPGYSSVADLVVENGVARLNYTYGDD